MRFGAFHNRFEFLLGTAVDSLREYARGPQGCTRFATGSTKKCEGRQPGGRNSLEESILWTIIKERRVGSSFFCPALRALSFRTAGGD